MKILHITESFGGGVATALQSYARNTPDLSHHLLAKKREKDLSSKIDLTSFKSVIELPDGVYKSVNRIRHSIKEIKPDVIHFHSSIAGALGRLCIIKSKNRKIIYTPHGFSFERRDVNGPLRLAFLIAENLLSLNTDYIAPCSKREEKLAKRMPVKVLFLPNAISTETMNQNVSPARANNKSSCKIVTIGRITNARDHFIISAMAKMATEHPQLQISFTWVGDGEEEARKTLEKAGVNVTGWKSKAEVDRYLRDADLMIHPARWDGFPMAILEAASAGTPVLTTKIPAFDELSEIVKFSSVEDGFEKLLQFSDDLGFRTLLYDATQKSLRNYTAETQKRALYRLYYS